MPLCFEVIVYSSSGIGKLKGRGGDENTYSLFWDECRVKEELGGEARAGRVMCASCLARGR